MPPMQKYLAFCRTLLGGCDNEVVCEEVLRIQREGGDVTQAVRSVACSFKTSAPPLGVPNAQQEHKVCPTKHSRDGIESKKNSCTVCAKVRLLLQAKTCSESRSS